MRLETLRQRLLTVAALATFVVVVDQLTKTWAEAAFMDRPVEIIPVVLTFTFTENRGSAFSLIRDAGAFLGSAAVVAVGVVVASVWKPRPLPEVIGLGLIGGGAVGNLVDRLVRGPGLFDGPVVDWIQFPNFPVFNLADSAITVGVVFLLIGSWRSD